MRRFLLGLQGQRHEIRFALALIAGFWLFYAATVLIRAGLLGEPGLIIRRLLNSAAGFVLTVGVYATMHMSAKDGNTRKMVVVGAVSCLPAAMVMAALSLRGFQLSPFAVRVAPEGLVVLLNPQAQSTTTSVGRNYSLFRLFAEAVVTWYYVFIVWCAVQIAVTQQSLMWHSEIKLTEAEAEASRAEVQAIRFNVHPNFLFKAFECLRSNIRLKDDHQAEAMLLALAAYFRSSLLVGPSVNVSLRDEIDLELLYLRVEELLLPGRFSYSVELPDQFAALQVPAFLLRPGIERAIECLERGGKMPVEICLKLEESDSDTIKLSIIIQRECSEQEVIFHSLIVVPNCDMEPAPSE